MARLRLSKRYLYAISGLGITEIALGCTIFCLALGSAEVLSNQTSYSNTIYFVSTLIDSIALVICGAIAIETGKRQSTCYLMLTLVFSTVANLISLGLLGLQVFVTVEWKREYTISNYTFAALIIGCIATGTSFFLCLTNICLTCSAGGACGDSGDVYPVNETANAKKNNQNGPVKVTTTGTTMTPTEASRGEVAKIDEPLALHDSRPNTAQINEYWN